MASGSITSKFLGLKIYTELLDYPQFLTVFENLISAPFYEAVCHRFEDSPEIAIISAWFSAWW